MAERQGLELQKSRRRDPRAIDYDRWLILDPHTNTIVAGTKGTRRHGMTRDAVEAYVTGDEWTFTKGALDDVLELRHDVAEEQRRAHQRRRTSRRPQRAASEGSRRRSLSSQLYRAARFTPTPRRSPPAGRCGGSRRGEGHPSSGTHERTTTGLQQVRHPETLGIRSGGCPVLRGRLGGRCAGLLPSSGTLRAWGAARDRPVASARAFADAVRHLAPDTAVRILVPGQRTALLC
jgi:hypothetical protein